MTIDGYPILERLLAQGTALSAATQDWMKKWRGMDLDSAQYEFKELSGSTSINMKIRKVDPTDLQATNRSVVLFRSTGRRTLTPKSLILTWLPF